MKRGRSRLAADDAGKWPHNRSAMRQARRPDIDGCWPMAGLEAFRQADDLAKAQRFQKPGQRQIFPARHQPPFVIAIEHNARIIDGEDACIVGVAAAVAAGRRRRTAQRAASRVWPGCRPSPMRRRPSSLSSSRNGTADSGQMITSGRVPRSSKDRAMRSSKISRALSPRHLSLWAMLGCTSRTSGPFATSPSDAASRAAPQPQPSGIDSSSRPATGPRPMAAVQHQQNARQHAQTSTSRVSPACPQDWPVAERIAGIQRKAGHSPWKTGEEIAACPLHQRQHQWQHHPEGNQRPRQPARHNKSDTQ